MIFRISRSIIRSGGMTNDDFQMTKECPFSNAEKISSASGACAAGFQFSSLPDSGFFCHLSFVIRNFLHHLFVNDLQRDAGPCGELPARLKLGRDLDDLAIECADLDGGL